MDKMKAEDKLTKKRLEEIQFSPRFKPMTNDEMKQILEALDKVKKWEEEDYLLCHKDEIKELKENAEKWVNYLKSIEESEQPISAERLNKYESKIFQLEAKVKELTDRIEGKNGLLSLIELHKQEKEKYKDENKELKHQLEEVKDEIDFIRANDIDGMREWYKQLTEGLKE